MSKTQEFKAYGSIRKMKVGGACGVILGLVSLSFLSPALADEITENKATNAPYAQTNPSSISTDNQGKSGQKQEASTVEVPHTELDSAVDKARNAGFVVVKENPVDKGIAETETDANAKLADIKQDYTNQKEQIEKKIEEYKNQSESANTNVESIVGNKPLVDSKDGLSLYGGFDRTYATSIGYHGFPLETIKKFSTLTEEEFNKRLESLKEKWRSGYENENVIRQRLAGDPGNEWDLLDVEKLLGSDYGKFRDKIHDLRRKDEGGIKYYDFLLLNDKGKTHAETLTGSIRWQTDTKVEDIAGVPDKFVNRAYKDPWKEGTGDYTLSTKFYDVHKGLTFKLANVGEFEDGSKLDLRFTVSEEPKIAYKYTSNPYLNTDNDNTTNREYGNLPTLTVGKAAKDDSLMFYYNNLQSLKFHVEFLKNGKKAKVALVTMISDVDWNQGSEFVFSNVTLKEQLYSPDEDKLTYSGSEGSYRQGLKIHEGHKVYAPFEDGIAGDKAQAPNGTYLVSGYGDSFDYTFYARKSVLDGTVKDDDFNYGNAASFIKASGGLQFNLFGSSAKGVSHSIIPKPEIHYHYNFFTVVPKPKNPEKHALDKTGKKVLDGKEVQMGELIQYLLDGSMIPERHHMLSQYDGLDKLDTKHDRYTGNWKGIIKGTEYTAEKELVLPYDVTLKDGKVVKAGDKIAKDSSYAFTFEFNQGTNSEFIKKLVTVKWDDKGGQWSYVINQDFLNSLGIKGTFDADFYIEVERIAAGELENTFVNIVNKQEMTAKVITRTPEPPKPKNPEKHALDKTGKKVLDGKEVQMGELIQYLLDGSMIPERHHMLSQYDGLDKLDTKHDRYTGNWKGIIKGTEYTAEKELVLPYDVTLKDGKVVKAGDKIAKDSSYAFTFEFNQGTNSEFIKKLVTVKWDDKGGQWSYVINQDFLNSLGIKGTFDADFYIEVERIAAGEVENAFVNIVNKQEMTAKVITPTPEPPKPKNPEKHALDKTGKKVLDGKEVQMGELIQYLLDGSMIPERHHMLSQYDGLDKLDTKHDRYTGNWKGIIKGTEYTAEKELVLPYDVTLKDGKVVKAGDKIAKDSSYAFTFEFNQGTNSEFIKKLVTVKWDDKGGQWSYVINQDFLNSLGIKGTFDADFYIEVERIAAGELENTFVNIVNKQEMTAKVITRTPEPPKPEEPKKEEPKPEPKLEKPKKEEPKPEPKPEPKTPESPKPQEPKNPSLPNTGTASSMLSVVGMILGLLSLAGAGLRKYKK